MNKRSMRILGFSQIRDMLVRLAPSRLSKEAARALKPDTDEDTVVKKFDRYGRGGRLPGKRRANTFGRNYGYSTLFGKGEARSDSKCR